jgi:type 1 fimbria pilin
MKQGFGRTTLMLWLLMAGVVSAASAANWDTDGLNGGIRASGTLVASPCALLPESAEQEIDLGSTVAWDWNGRVALRHQYWCTSN